MLALETSDDLVRHCLEASATAMALAHPASLELIWENARFAEWFPGDGASLAARIGLDADRARDRLGRGRPLVHETEVDGGPRRRPVALQLRLTRHGDRELVLVEGHDVSKQKEAEYMLDSYSRLAERHARELRKEKDRIEKLLLNVMPRPVYEEMRELGTTTPHRFEAATVLMLDFAGFTQMAVSRDPSALVAELNDIFSAFDRIVEMYGGERIKTVGDGYVAVSGLPDASPEDAANMARIALRMRHYLERRNHGHAHTWRCRIGIATGPLIGSLIGIHKYVYDIFGPAANLAARLEALCEPMQIHLCPTTAARIKGEFLLEPRGSLEIRGFGPQEVHTLEGETDRRL
jgi:adenylate cyclase